MIKAIHPKLGHGNFSEKAWDLLKGDKDGWQQVMDVPSKEVQEKMAANAANAVQVDVPAKSVQHTKKGGK